MAGPLRLAGIEAGSVSWAKITATARHAGLGLEQLAGGVAARTPCGLSVPELELPTGGKVKYTNAILRRIAQVTDCGLMGNSFVEEGQVDSWLDWSSLVVDHVALDAERSPEASSFCENLEAHLQARTFLVGQRLTLADISVACSLRPPLEKAGLDTLRKSYPNTVRWLRTCVHQLGLTGTPAPPAPAASAPAPKKEAPKAAPAAPKQQPEASAPKAAPAAPAAAEQGEDGGDKAGKNAEKKKKKEEEKKAKEEEKKRKEVERLEAQANKHKGPDVKVKDIESASFGNLFIQSEVKTGRTWTPVVTLTTELKDQSVWVRARVHNSRKQGGKLTFVTLRQDLATVQAVVAGQEMAGFAGGLPDESVVDILAKVVCPDAKITSCSQSDVELGVEKIFCIGRSTALPLQLADAGRSDAEYEKDPSLVRVGQDTRLDNRVIDVRTVANQAIFRIQSAVCMFFREYLYKNSFQEIHTPKLIGGASEGGADVFRVDYFEGNAFLAQSPQLYKQMALMTDMPRVFEIGPIFRSERSFTHRHMTEFTGLDLEMTFKDHYHEVLDVIDGLFNHIFTGLTKTCSREIEAVRAQFPFEDLKWKYPCLRMTFKEAIQLLRAEGPAILKARLAAAGSDYERGIIQKHLESVEAHEDEEDISTEDEKLLGIIIHKKHGEDFYIIDKFPKDVRPFYTMPDPEDARWTNAYDLFLRGEEITSGAQRIHDPKMLADKAASLGIDVRTIQPYVDAFKYGSYPHAGCGIGMERVVMLFLNLNNIRKSSLFPRDPKRLTP